MLFQSCWIVRTGRLASSPLDPHISGRVVARRLTLERYVAPQLDQLAAWLAARDEGPDDTTAYHRQQLLGQLPNIEMELGYW